MHTKDQQARAFALAIATIRSDAETLDDAPLYCNMADRKTYRHVDHLPRKEYRLPAPGNPRGMIVSAPAARDSLNALADRLEKGARAFGGTPPKRDRSPLNTRGIVAARNAHAEGHRNAAHRALGDRLFIDASGAPFAVVSQMQAAGHDILLCRSIAARSNTIIAFCARSGVRLATAGQTSGSAPADFNDFCAWVASRAVDYSGKMESMASLDQAAAVAEYLAGDTVEIIDPDAEPCDTAAAIARAEASAKPKPEPVPEPEREAQSNCAPTQHPAELNGFSREDIGGGAFYLVSGNMRVRVEPTYSGNYQAHFGSARSSPHLQGVAGAVAWASVYREDAKRLHKTTTHVKTAATRHATNASPSPSPSRAIELAEASTKPEPTPAPAPAPGDAAIPKKAGDTTGEKLAGPQDVMPRARLFQPPARMVVPRGQIRAAKVTARMPGAPPSDETQAASRSNPWAGETSRRRQSRCYTMRRRKDLCLPPRRSMPLRTRRRCARRRHVPPRTRPGSMPPRHAVATGTPDFLRYHRSIECRYLNMPRKLHKPPDQKATHAAGSYRPRHVFTLRRRDLNSRQAKSPPPPLHNITRASRGLPITKVELTT